MQLKREHKRKIVLGIAILFLLYGLLDMKFKFNFSPNTVNNVSMVLVILAFGLLFSGRKPKPNSSDETETNSTKRDTIDNPETNSYKQDTIDKPEIDSSKQDTGNLLETSDNKQVTDDDNANSTQVELDEKDKVERNYNNKQ